MDRQSLISIIIPCYNQAIYLAESVKSVINQTYSNWECIIINDGSPDNTADVSKFLCQLDPRIYYFEKTNSGLSDTRNFGIRNSHGKYILPLDADDKIAPTYIEKAVDFLDVQTGSWIVYANGEFFGEKNGPMQLADFDLKKMLFDDQLYCSAIYRREDYDRTEGYCTTLPAFEDWDFWLSMIENGASFYKLPESLFYYRYKSQSMLRNLTNDKIRELYLIICKRHSQLYRNYYGDISYLMFRNFQLNHQYQMIANSNSYKLGKFILFLPGKLKDFISKLK